MGFTCTQVNSCLPLSEQLVSDQPLLPITTLLSQQSSLPLWQSSQALSHSSCLRPKGKRCLKALMILKRLHSRLRGRNKLKIAEVNSLCGPLAAGADLQGAELSVRDQIYLRLGVLSYVMCTNDASVRINVPS